MPSALGEVKGGLSLDQPLTWGSGIRSMREFLCPKPPVLGFVSIGS